MHSEPMIRGSVIKLSLRLPASIERRDKKVETPHTSLPTRTQNAEHRHDPVEYLVNHFLPALAIGSVAGTPRRPPKTATPGGRAEAQFSKEKLDVQASDKSYCVAIEQMAHVNHSLSNLGQVVKKRLICSEHRSPKNACRAAL